MNETPVTYEWYTKDGKKEMRDGRNAVKKYWLAVGIEIAILILIMLPIIMSRLHTQESSGAIRFLGVIIAPAVAGIVLMTVITLLITIRSHEANPIDFFATFSLASFVSGIITIIVCLLFADKAKGFDAIIFIFPMYAATCGMFPTAFVSSEIETHLETQQKHRKRLYENSLKTKEGRDDSGK